MQAAPPRWPTAACWSDARSACGSDGCTPRRLPAARLAAGTTGAASSNAASGPPSHHTGPASVTTSPSPSSNVLGPFASVAPSRSAASTGANRGCSGCRASTVFAVIRCASTSDRMVSPGDSSHHGDCQTGDGSGNSPSSSMTSRVRPSHASRSRRPVAALMSARLTRSRSQPDHASGTASPGCTNRLRPSSGGPASASALNLICDLRSGRTCLEHSAVPAMWPVAR